MEVIERPEMVRSTPSTVVVLAASPDQITV